MKVQKYQYTESKKVKIKSQLAQTTYTVDEFKNRTSSQKFHNTDG